MTRNLRECTGCTRMVASARFDPIPFIKKEVDIYLRSHKNLQYWDTGGFTEAAFIAYTLGLRCFDDTRGMGLQTFLRQRIWQALSNHYKRESKKVINDSFSILECSPVDIEARNLINRAVSSLTDHEFDVFNRYFVENCSMTEIGAVFGVTRARIHQIVCVIRRKMKRKLASAGARNSSKT